MPVMVVGADTPPGARITHRLLHPDREVRVFVTDPAAAEKLRQTGAKVALGDVTDASHLTGACHDCFSVVLVGEAATDERERSFASTQRDVLATWAASVGSARVKRVIWVLDGDPPEVDGAETARADPSDPELAEVVWQLDEVAEL